MKYNRLGKSDLHVSEIGFGCMSLGDDPSGHSAILNRAFDLGINFFDTADIYQQGRNETSLGKALSAKRSQVILATKVGNQLKSSGNGWDWNPTKEYILSSVEGSLRRLQTDYIDLYQLHGGTIDDPMDETIEAFETLQQQGKIRYYGISSIRPNVIREYVSRSGIVSVMMQYGLLDRRPEEACLNLLREHSTGVLARGSLAKGLLVNKPPSAFLKLSPANVLQAAEAVHQISGDHRSSSQTAIRFALHHPAVTSAIVGIRTAEQLEEAAGAQHTPPLTGDEIQTLAAAVPAQRYEEHR